MDIPIYFFTALISTFFYAVGAVYSKMIMSHTKNPITLMIYQFTINLIVVAIAFIVLSFLGTDFRTMFELQNFIILIISAFFIFLGVITFYYGLNIGNVSVATVVLSSRVLFIIPIGILFLGEIYPETTYLWIFVIVLGILLVSWDTKLSIKDVLFFKGTYYYILTNIFWSIANSLIRFLHNDVHFVGIILIRLIVLTSLIFLVASTLNTRFSYPPIEKKFNRRFFLIVTVLVLLLFMGDLGYIYSLGFSATITEAIGSLQGLFVFVLILLLSKVQFFKDGLEEPLDKKTLSVRILGMVLATIGTVGIALAL